MWNEMSVMPRGLRWEHESRWRRGQRRAACCAVGELPATTSLCLASTYRKMFSWK